MNLPELDYLHQNNLDQDLHYDENEVVYRRYQPQPNNLAPTNKFLAIRTNDLKAGLSLNRSKHCNNPQHTMYFISDNPNEENKCEHELRIGFVASIPIDKLPQVITCSNDENNDSIHVSLSFKHDPTNCNRSHSILEINPVPEDNTLRIDLKLKLGTIFQSVQ
jgi:hypothetical protein